MTHRVGIDIFFSRYARTLLDCLKLPDRRKRQAQTNLLNLLDRCSHRSIQACTPDASHITVSAQRKPALCYANGSRAAYFPA